MVNISIHVNTVSFSRIDQTIHYMTMMRQVTLDLLKNWNNGIYVIGEKRQLRTFPAFLASSTPVVDKSASCQPQKRFFWFHSLSP